MLYYYTGNSDYLVLEQVKTWKNRFIDKFGDFNLLEIKNIEEVDNNFLIENLTATSFLGDKKLVIIHVEKNDEKNNFILSLFDKIPENNIILFHQTNPDKRNKFYKELVKKAEVKEFNIKQESDLSSILNKKYNGKISSDAINLLIRYKASNISKCISEIEKLLITKEFIEKKDIIDHIMPELEESIYQMIDNILNLNQIEAINIMNTILNDTNIYAFYNNLIANIRTNIYILKLKKSKFNPKQITDILNLGNRGFLVNKSHKISFEKLEKFYIGLINLDKRIKTGNLMGSEDKVLIFEIEKMILKLS